jgi:hypothetical protein
MQNHIDGLQIKQTSSISKETNYSYLELPITVASV